MKIGLLGKCLKFVVECLVSDKNVMKKIKAGKIICSAEEFCIQYRLKDIDSLISFCTSESTAYSFERASTRVKNEIQSICHEYLSGRENISMDVSIRKLAFIQNMTRRTLNICIYSGIVTLRELLKYKLIKSDFLTLRNCGPNSNQELIQICEKYDTCQLREELITQGLLEQSQPVEDNPVSVQVVENHDLEILSELENMSTRSYNVCKSAGITSLKMLLEFYLKSKKHFLELRNCGIKSNEELTGICKKYISSVTGYLQGNATINNEEFSALELFINSLKLSNDSYIKLRSVISSYDQFPIFASINSLIDSNYIFRKKMYSLIFKLLLHCYLPVQDHTLEEVGEMVGLTRERIRQIRHTFLRNLTDYFSFVINLGDRIKCVEYFKPEMPIIYISEEETNRINSIENTNFSSLFITYILSLVHSKEYVWFGDKNEFINKSNQQQKRKLKCNYLIHKEITDNFELIRFIENLASVSGQSRSGDVRVPFSDLFQGYYRKEHSIDRKIIAVLNVMLITEFDQKIGIASDGLIFYQNIEKSVVGQITEILQHNIKPLHYGEIYKMLAEKGIFRSIETVHSILNRESEIFGLKGPGRFCLKINGGYFGTIGDVAEQILSERKAPMPFQQLLDIISTELVVSRDSVKNNLFHYKHEVRFKLTDGNVSLSIWETQEP